MPLRFLGLENPPLTPLARMRAQAPEAIREMIDFHEQRALEAEAAIDAANPASYTAAEAHWCAGALLRMWLTSMLPSPGIPGSPTPGTPPATHSTEPDE